MKGVVVDLTDERAARRPATTRFTLEARDAGSEPGKGCFLWTWSTENNDDASDQWRPSTRHVGAQLRRIADRYDPQPKGSGARRRRDRTRRR